MYQILIAVGRRCLWASQDGALMESLVSIGDFRLVVSLVVSDGAEAVTLGTCGGGPLPRLPPPGRDDKQLMLNTHTHHTIP